MWIGRDRVAAARALLAANPGCDVIVCDDGLQHYRLQRDFEIAVLDGSRGLGNGLPLPAGPLREGAARLQSVDAVVINGSGDPDMPMASRFDVVPTRRSLRLRLPVFWSLRNSTAGPLLVVISKSTSPSRSKSPAASPRPTRACAKPLPA